MSGAPAPAINPATLLPAWLFESDGREPAPESIRVDLPRADFIGVQSAFPEERPCREAGMTLRGVSLSVIGKSVFDGFFQQREGPLFDQGLQHGALAIFECLADVGQRLLPGVSNDDSGAGGREDVAVGVDVDAPAFQDLSRTVVAGEGFFRMSLYEML
jgi:hypothetical protein